jgi:hypothetical protein
MIRSLWRFTRLIIFAGLSIHFYGRVGNHPEGFPLDAGMNAALFGTSLAFLSISLNAVVASRIRELIAETRIVEASMSAYLAPRGQIDSDPEQSDGIWGAGEDESKQLTPQTTKVQERHYVWADSLTPIEYQEETL